MTNKDLIRQYAQTGAILPSYQLKKLNTNMLRTYFRRRILQCQNHDFYDLKHYELKLMPEDMMNSYLDSVPWMKEEMFYEYLTEEQQNYFIEAKLKLLIKGLSNDRAYRRMLNHEMIRMTPEQIKRYDDAGFVIPNAVLDKLKIIHSSPQEREEWIIKSISLGHYLSNWIWIMVEPDMLDRILPHLISQFHISDVPPKYRKEFVMARLRKGFYMDGYEIGFMEEDEVQECIMYLINNDVGRINDDCLNAMSNVTFEHFIKKVNNEQ